MISVSTVSDTIDHSVVDPRFHPIHWRFQELLIVNRTGFNRDFLS